MIDAPEAPQPGGVRGAGVAWVPMKHSVCFQGEDAETEWILAREVTNLEDAR